MKFLCLGFLILVHWGQSLSIVFAQSKRLTTQPTPRVLQTKLDNGLDFIFIENRALPILSAQLFVKNGAFNQSFGEQGIAYLIEKSISLSNYLHLKPLENQQFFVQQAISFYSETNIEYTRFSMDLLASQATVGLSWLAGAVRQPTFDSLLVQQLCGHLGDSLLQRDSDPLYSLQSKLSRLLWGESVYRKQVITDVELLAGYTASLLRYQYNHYYFPNHCALVISGDGDFGQLYGLVDSLFGSWKPLLMNQYVRFPIPDIKPLLKDTCAWREVLHEDYSVLSIGFHGPDFRGNPEDIIAMMVLTELLNFQQSQFQTSLSTKIPGMLSGMFRFVPRKHTGELYFNAVVAIEHSKPSISEDFRALLHEILLENYFTEKEIKRAKQRVERSWIRSFQKNSDFAREFGVAWVVFQPDWIEQRNNILYRLSLSDLQKTWHNWVINRNFALSGNVPAAAYQKNFLPTKPKETVLNSVQSETQQPTDSTLTSNQQRSSVIKQEKTDTLLCVKRNRLQIDVNTRKILQECYKIVTKNKLSKLVLTASYDEAKGGAARSRAFQQAIFIKNELTKNYKMPYSRTRVVLLPTPDGNDGCVKLSLDLPNITP